MPRSDNEKILLRAAESFSDPARRDGYFDLYDPACLLHGYPGVEPGLTSIKQFYRSLWTSFPDARLEIEDAVAEGDKLAARFVVRATHRGDFMGVPATGRPVTVSGITILRFRDGRCLGRWSEANFLAVLQQIGSLPAG